MAWLVKGQVNLVIQSREIDQNSNQKEFIELALKKKTNFKNNSLVMTLIDHLTLSF